MQTCSKGVWLRPRKVRHRSACAGAVTSLPPSSSMNARGLGLLMKTTSPGSVRVPRGAMSSSRRRSMHRAPCGMLPRISGSPMSSSFATASGARSRSAMREPLSFCSTPVRALVAAFHGRYSRRVAPDSARIPIFGCASSNPTELMSNPVRCAVCMRSAAEDVDVEEKTESSRE